MCMQWISPGGPTKPSNNDIAAAVYGYTGAYTVDYTMNAYTAA